MGAPNLFVVLGAILPRCAPAAISHKFQRYTASTKQYKINRTFNIQRKFPNHNNQGEAEIPDKQETRRFWNNIWGNTEGILRRSNPKSTNIITKEDIKNKSKKMANWKSRGPDQVQGYWLKRLTSLHERLAQQLQNILDDPNCMPSWLTTGRTVLIQKDQMQGNKPSNYRPITYRSTTWKLLSGFLADQIAQHLNHNDILA